jgi:UDP-GlcNAc:undecaprenyl-phosphate GlcNAc-1-phosphate transferase
MSLTPLRKVFLGDAGSLVLGFLIAWLLIALSQGSSPSLHPVMTIWCVTLPVFDTIVVVARRLRHGRSPFSADRRHLHHLLLDAGFSKQASLAVMLAAALVFNVSGLVVTATLGSIWSLALWGLYLIAFMAVVYHPKVEAGASGRHRQSRVSAD